MRREERVEGTPLTRRRRILDVAETPSEMIDTMRKIAKFVEDPWQVQRATRDSIAEALQAEIAARPDGYKFEPRVDAGWYLQELAFEAKVIDHHISKGEASRAAVAGIKFGRLYAEFELERARGALYCHAVEVRQRFSDAGKKGHPSSLKERLETVRRMLKRHPSHKQAYALAAKELSSKYGKPISIRQVRRSWEDAQKSKATAD